MSDFMIQSLIMSVGSMLKNLLEASKRYSRPTSVPIWKKGGKRNLNFELLLFAYSGYQRQESLELSRLRAQLSDVLRGRHQRRDKVRVHGVLLLHQLHHLIDRQWLDRKLFS